MKIDQKEFTDWLMQQPDERESFYFHGLPTDDIPCPMCAFLREAKHVKDFQVGGTVVTINDDSQELPQWFLDLAVNNVSSAKDLKQRLLAQPVE